jgi:hypothetical protein
MPRRFAINVPASSHAEELREEIIVAAREAAVLIARGHRGVKVQACLDRAAKAVVRLELLYGRMGITDRRDETIQMQAIIERLRAKLKAMP